MDAPTATLIASSLGTLAAAIGSAAVGVLNYMRESRAHEWALQAHAEDKQERQVASDSIHAKIDDAQQDIAAGSKAASAAYEVANTINEKIAAIGQVRIASLEPQQRRKDDHA